MATEQRKLSEEQREALRHELCPKCRHPWWEHARSKERLKILGCGSNVDNLGAAWAVEPGPCGCQELQPKQLREDSHEA